jgi:type IV secretion system protein VirD4
VNKKSLKIMLFAFLSVIGVVAGFFFAGYVNLLLSGGGLDDLSPLRPVALIASVASDGRHRMLTLCVCSVAVAGIAALILMSRKDTFESDTAAVAGDIQTPVAIGQGQHGTARWLKPAEQRRVFSMYRLDRDAPVFSGLLETGARDHKEIEDDDKKSVRARVAGDTPPQTK